MRYLLDILALTLLLLTGGCVKNEFKIEITLPSDSNESYRIVYYASASNGGRLIETVAAPSGGKCDITGITRNPTLVYVYRGSSSSPGAIFYAERGDKIKIESQDTDPSKWEIEGNEISSEWSRWRIENHAILSSGSSGQEKVNTAVARYVKAHPASKLSPLLLLTSYSRTLDESGFASLWKTLDKKADADAMAALAGRADQPGIELAEGARLTALPVMLRGDSMDTIRMGKARGGIIYFWHADNEARHAIIDSLKRLAKDYPDSTSRLIADISLSPDSTEWIMTSRYDSLRTTRHGWIFRGEADMNVSALGVRGTPWLIVTDSKGNQRYRGSDIGKATGEFRRIMSK